MTDFSWVFLLLQALDEAVAFGSENFDRWTGSDDATGFHLEHVGLRREDFAYVMSDEQDWGPSAFAPELQVADQVVAKIGFQAGKGLVQHEQTAGANRDGAGESDTLALAARELRRHLGGEVRNPAKLEYGLQVLLVRVHLLTDVDHGWHSIDHILEHVEMREEGWSLGNHADSPLMRGRVGSG